MSVRHREGQEERANHLLADYPELFLVHSGKRGGKHFFYPATAHMHIHVCSRTHTTYPAIARLAADRRSNRHQLEARLYVTHTLADCSRRTASHHRTRRTRNQAEEGTARDGRAPTGDEGV